MTAPATCHLCQGWLRAQTIAHASPRGEAESLVTDAE
jgi:hypothetical protein